MSHKYVFSAIHGWENKMEVKEKAKDIAASA